MPILPTDRLETFAWLIAIGYPPVLAARSAGYYNRRASRAAARMDEPGVAERIAAFSPPPEPEPEPAPAAPTATRPAKARAAPPPVVEEIPAPAPAPRPIRRELTEEEWIAKYAPEARIVMAAGA